jgi:hypothetical protein
MAPIIFMVTSIMPLIIEKAIMGRCLHAAKLLGQIEPLSMGRRCTMRVDMKARGGNLRFFEERLLGV